MITIVLPKQIPYSMGIDIYGIEYEIEYTDNLDKKLSDVLNSITEVQFLYLHKNKYYFQYLDKIFMISFFIYGENYLILFNYNKITMTYEELSVISDIIMQRLQRIYKIYCNNITTEIFGNNYVRILSSRSKL